MIFLFFALLSYASDSTVILLMVDGARPDVIETMAKEGKLPFIKKTFLDEGTMMENSFTTLSLTVPSWSAILTGVDIDKSGIKGNDIFHRETKKFTNFLDWREDIFDKKNRAQGRAYSHLKAANILAGMDYFDQNRDKHGRATLDPFDPKSEVFFTFFPLNQAFPTYLLKTLPNNLLSLDVWSDSGAQRALTHFFYQNKGMDSVDRDSTEQALRIIQDREGKKKKLIGIYFPGVDHASHSEHRHGRRTLQKVDYLIGKILRAVEKSRYKNSTFVLVSDHGSLGGEEYSHSKTHPLAGKTAGLTNTNLSQFFGGWYNKPGYSDYSFNVESAYAMEGKFALNNFAEIQLHPNQCTNVARRWKDKYSTCEDFSQTKPQMITAAVTSSQTVSLPYASFQSGNWGQENNWETLTNYEVSKGKFRNILTDLENFELDNLLVYDSKVLKVLGKRPLAWLVTRINNSDFQKSPLADELNLSSEEDILIFHQSKDSQALLLTKDGKYRYVPIKNFSSEAGNIRFELSDKDPLGYLKHLKDVSWYANYHSTRDWIEEFKETVYPNAVPAMAKMFHNRGPKSNEKWKVDLVLNPNYGHYFTVNNDVHEVNHGMWQRESVRHSFFLSGKGVKKGYRVKSATMSVDVLPTAFRAAGFSFSMDQGVEGSPVADALLP